MPAIRDSHSKTDRARLRIYAGWGAVWLFTVAYIVAFTLWPSVVSQYVRCPLYALTGVHCPSCGLSSAMSQLLAGHFVLALRSNMLVVPVVLILGAFPVVWTTDLIGRRTIIEGLHRRIFG